jgi:benzoate membrane transport protein
VLARLRTDFSLSATLAGLIALFATYSGPVLIVVQAAQAGHLGHAALSTWIWALSMGAGLVGLVLTSWYRDRRLVHARRRVADFRPRAISVRGGRRLLPHAGAGRDLLGFSGLFSRLMARVPEHLLSAMIAGVLFQFCARIFQSLQAFPAQALPIVMAHVAMRRLLPRYAAAGALAVGLVCSALGHRVDLHALDLHLADPQAVMPTLSFRALVGLGFSLILLALTQHGASIHILRNAGYTIPATTVVGVSGLLSIPLSLFGNCGVNPPAIVGAICASPECHADPSRRYVSGVVAGIGYLGIGIFGASVIALFSSFPDAFTTTLAGLVLLGTLLTACRRPSPTNAARRH